MPRDRQILVICTPHDAGYLHQRGLKTVSLPENHRESQTFLGGHIRAVTRTHGKGAIGLLMEHDVGYFIERPAEPSLYLSGDTILTDTVREFLLRHQPQVSLVPPAEPNLISGMESSRASLK